MKNHGQLRIIAGEDHGRRLQSPSDIKIRPTSGIAREAIFNILQQRIPGCDFLDLYAGTGAVGLEALSRGAGTVTFVEHNRQGVELLHDNIFRMTRSGDCRLWSGSVANQCKRFEREQRTFDLIFIDPPYDQQGIEIRFLEPLLSVNGILIFQRPIKKTVGNPFKSTRLEQYDLRHYGKTEISFWTFPENLIQGEPEP